MAGIYNNRSVSASVVVQGTRRESTPRPDFIGLENGQRTAVDDSTYNARSCPLFAAGGYLTQIITFSASRTLVDHPLNRNIEGMIVALLLDQPTQLYVVEPATPNSRQITIGNDSGLTCRARLWIF